jgi:hypothetical protein
MALRLLLSVAQARAETRHAVSRTKSQPQVAKKWDPYTAHSSLREAVRLVRQTAGESRKQLTKCEYIPSLKRPRRNEFSFQHAQTHIDNPANAHLHGITIKREQAGRGRVALRPEGTPEQQYDHEYVSELLRRIRALQSNNAGLKLSLLHARAENERLRTRSREQIAMKPTPSTTRHENHSPQPLAHYPKISFINYDASSSLFTEIYEVVNRHLPPKQAGFEHQNYLNPRQQRDQHDSYGENDVSSAANDLLEFARRNGSLTQKEFGSVESIEPSTFEDHFAWHDRSDPTNSHRRDNVRMWQGPQIALPSRRTNSFVGMQQTRGFQGESRQETTNIGISLERTKPETPSSIMPDFDLGSPEPRQVPGLVITPPVGRNPSRRLGPPRELPSNHMLWDNGSLPNSPTSVRTPDSESFEVEMLGSEAQSPYDLTPIIPTMECPTHAGWIKVNPINTFFNTGRQSLSYH